MGGKNEIKKPKSKILFPKIKDDKLLYTILSYLMPHEIIKSSFLNSYILRHIND